MTRQKDISRSKVAVASLVGTTIEFYDFYIYGIAAALVFKTVFFPTLDPVTGTIAAFATFAVGFVSRPLGAIVFGHFGDRIGRKAMLVASLLTMGIATVLVGLLPTYSSIGVMAPVALCVLRFAQGFGLGGEWGGAALLATEYAPKGKRGLFGALPQLGSAPGFLLSNGIFLLLSVTLPEEQFLDWGWRIPFLLSIVLIMFGLYIRLTIAETPVFQKVLEQEKQSKAPVMEVMKTHFLQVVLGGMATAITYVLFFTTGTFGLSYGVDVLGFSRSHMLTLTMVAVIAMAASTLLCGMLSDKYGRSRVIVISAMIAAVWAFFFFPLLDTRNTVVIMLAMSGTLAIMGGVYGPMGAYLPELFKANVRYTGAALSYSLGGIFGGALAPIIATDLAANYGSHSIGWYMAGMALLSILSVSILRGRMPKNFEDTSHEEPNPAVRVPAAATGVR
ncbi:metabolite-proton symporter [Pseudaminobacter salicylatoxidans]|uniref:Metabolite-proton symporter n=1 Tax=Pseudaminobacter salicylatoxidans TaxID=93369 RepID=A0A316C4P2_PSESE|nr:MFS transporter [Pseudaminobacter salicylatoxidans]PWJ84528.1 metabolite-proton symporter [Pseudaminobacter salicylatoxidans]